VRRVYDTLIIGAGVIGLSIAWAQARSGRRVAVLERETRPGAASRAAAGMLAPQAEAGAPDAFFELALRGRARFAGFAALLQDETGHCIDYRRDGLIAFAFDVDEESELARRAEWQHAAGLAVEELTRGEVGKRWPELELPETGALGDAPDFAEGRLFYFPEEAQVDGELLMEALVEACRRAGAEVWWGADARALSIEGNRVQAVRLETGELSCEVLVNAAGAWAGRIAAWAGEPLPVSPVRGQMLAFATDLRPPRPIVVDGQAYSLLRRSRSLLVGATVERQGYDSATTAEGRTWLEARAAALVPGLAGQQPTAHWAGLRPGTPDDLPILGFSREVRNLYHATGHFRNGLLLAPVTADLACAALNGEAEDEEAVAAFAPSRFLATAEASV
jgi:glycine oxidase